MGTTAGLAKDIISGALDLIYPPHCLACKQEGEHYLCAECIEQIDIIEPPYCWKCGLPCESFHCEGCREREFAFESACSAAVFDGAMREAIHQLKYGCHLVLADPLGELMARCFAGTRLGGKVDFAVPIPIHRSRLLQRGFNQAAELTRRLGGRIGLPVKANVLVKARETRHQVDLPHDLRVSNVQGVFAVSEPGEVAGKRILLVDDVFTTGSTLNEAAMTLRNAGATTIYVYTLARSL